MKTKKQQIKDKLNRDGFVDNLWSIQNKVSARLASIIFELKKDGYVFDEEYSGFLPGTKNWCYYLSKKPVKLRIRLVERNREYVGIKSYA